MALVKPGGKRGGGGGGEISVNRYLPDLQNS